MLERLYVDNFRCFVNFEWKPARLALLLGENGSGKTSSIEVLWGIRSLIVGELEARRVFPSSSRTRWTSRALQRVELDVRLPEGLYSYVLLVEHDEDDPAQSRIKLEELHLDQALLVGFTNGELHLFFDDGMAGPSISTRASRSGLGAVAPGHNFRKIGAFKKWLEEEVWYFKPDPRAMSGRTDDPGDVLDVNLRNFASWYPTVITRDLDAAIQTQRSLREVFRGFDSLAVDKSRPQLQARFASGRKGAPYSVDFLELSDGQRALIALYLIRHAVLKPGRLIIFDEPDNYVALKEIQPWLLEVSETALDRDGPQVWFVSHHPEILNQLAPSHGTRFFREEEGPSRIERFKGMPELSAAEVVARGLEGVVGE